MRNNLRKRVFTSAAIAGIAALGLVGCSNSVEDESQNDRATQSEEEVTEDSKNSEDNSSTENQEDPSDSNDMNDPDAPVSNTNDDEMNENTSESSAMKDAPTAVAGYTSEAEEDLKEEKVSQDEVEKVLADPEKVERDDDGWELEKGNLKVDTLPDGTVVEVDRDED